MSHKEDKIDALTTQLGSQQIIKEPTNILAESFFCIDLIFTSRIDLIFTSHQNLVIESRVKSSLHLNCHHQIAYTKFNLKIHYLPPSEREIWHYEQANVDHVTKAVGLFPWEKHYKIST